LDSSVVWFDDDDLQRLAGVASFQRGARYLDAVGDLEESPGAVTAVVRGTVPYRVRLSEVRGTLVGQCSCPHAGTGAFCKHCVAVGLVVLGDTPAPDPAPEAAPKRRQSRRKVDLGAYLASVERAELVDLLLELAADDPALHRRLSLRAAVAGEVDPVELRRLVDTLRSRGFRDYAASFPYAEKADDVLDMIDKLVPTDAATAGLLYRRALQHLTKALEQADDSSGVIGAAAARALDGYAAACGAAPPDPVELAHWLVDFTLDWVGWPVAIADFAEPLGDAGLTAYWEYLTRLHQSQPGRSAITQLREDYLRTVSRDVDALVALYAEGLPEPYRYVQIAETLRGDGRVDEAVDWLERGLREAARRDSRIDGLLAELYAETGRPADALEAYWRVFTDLPEVKTHRALLDAAELAGKLAETSDRAAAFLRERATRGGYAADPLVTILLATGDVDAAWAAANEFGCSGPFMFAVADRRAQTHPGDAIPVYTRGIESAVAQTNRSGYAEAARLLAVLKELHQRAGSDFAGYLADLKDRHRRKTALLAELQRARL
jgi:uncharacterized Zn finger protein